MDDTKTSAINTGDAFLNGVDITSREKEILLDVSLVTGFILDKELWKSSYYGSEQVGAVLYQGTWRDKKAVLKIQGVKPEISEITMVEGFDQQNKSKIVRPPKFFETILWSEEKGYEAIIMEDVIGNKVLDSKSIQTIESLNEFFDVYKEYRDSCINTPWFGQSSELSYGKKEIGRMKQMIKKLKPESVLRKSEDLILAEEAVRVINEIWKGKSSEFMHGHFSAEDLVRQGDEVVLFSNLFWKWKHKFYDAVFAYHYCMISLTHNNAVDVEIFDKQRGLWLSKIESLARNGDDGMMIKAALLERMVACLLVDGIMFVNESGVIANHLIESTRTEIRRLIES